MRAMRQTQAKKTEAPALMTSEGSNPRPLNRLNYGTFAPARHWVSAHKLRQEVLVPGPEISFQKVVFVISLLCFIIIEKNEV
jgi:hypothetical protein